MTKTTKKKMTKADPLALEALGLTDDVLAALMAAQPAPMPKPAAKATSAVKGPAVKREGGQIAAVLDAIKTDGVLTALSFPESNYWSQTHADKLLTLALAGDMKGVLEYKVGGTNTYAKRLRRYQEICLQFAQSSIDAAPGSAAA